MDATHRDHRVDFISTVMLGLATVLTAWAAFQSSKWSGRQNIAFAESQAQRTMAARFAARADQRVALEAGVFIAWTQAVMTEGRADELYAHGYQPKVGTLSGFLYERFPKDFEPAVDAWLERRPFQNRDAPATPFEMPEYRRVDLDKAARLHQVADARSGDARRFNLCADHYTALTVVFSSVLFLAGVLTKIKVPAMRLAILIFAVLILVLGCAVLVTFPVALR